MQLYTIDSNSFSLHFSTVYGQFLFYLLAPTAPPPQPSVVYPEEGIHFCITLFNFHHWLDYRIPADQRCTPLDMTAAMLDDISQVLQLWENRTPSRTKNKTQK